MLMEVNKRYFIWLCDRIKLQGHDMLMKSLYEHTFTSIISSDVAREHDGLCLRNEFIDEYLDHFPTIAAYINPQCNVLELLISLAERWDRQYMYDPNFGCRSSMWFEEMLRNLNVLAYDDLNWTEDSSYQVDMVLDDLISRRYDFDGLGGLFPILNPHRDQRSLGIWDQLGDYINDRYSPNNQY